MNKTQLRDILQPFRPRARVLQLLGDELIGSARLAVFELVKNAYDADANVVTVSLNLASGKKPSIVVEDDGEGMTPDEASAAANMRTRLNPFTPAEIALLLRAGYAGADASLRARGLAVNDPAARFESLLNAEPPLPSLDGDRQCA